MAFVVITRTFKNAAGVAYASHNLIIKYDNEAGRKAPLFTSTAGTTALDNPVATDVNGVATAYVDDRKAYKGELWTANGATLIWKGALTHGLGIATQPVA